MPSIINSDSGATSGSAGLKFTSADDGVLEIQSSGNTALSISSTGVVSFINPPKLSVPVGTIFYLAGNVLPAGYLKCNGAELSRALYSDLFDQIGATYGVGDGSTTFLLPDLRGEFIRGWDDGRGVDSNRVFGSYQANDFEAHNHTFTINPVNRSFSGWIVNSNGNNNKYGYLSGGWGTEASISINNRGGTETRPRNLAMLACIKY